MCIPFLCITLGCLQCSRLELCLQPSELHYCCQVSSQKTTTFKFAEHLKANLFSCLDLLTFILCYINEIIIITITDLQCTETIEHLDQVSSGNLFITTCSELRKVLFWASLVCSFFFRLCTKYIGNRWTDLHQIHAEDVFGPSVGRVWRSKVKVTRDKKRHFSVLWWHACSLCLVKHL